MGNTNYWFQSAPRSRDRGDALLLRNCDQSKCFNPRPGHATGATPGDAFCFTDGTVSIRAPVTRPGRPHVFDSAEPRGWFQSAPRSRDRGDLAAEPQRHRAKMFQSAPRSRDRGDVGGLRSNVPDIRFNPRPGHATGATHCSCGTVTKVSVSIRAPVTRPGRLSDPLLTYQDCAFQSAPRSRDRGDSAPRPQQTRTEPFQSAPRSRDRGDPVWLMINAVSRSFNPRPGHATGATGCHGVARFRHVCFNPRPGHATGATCQSATRVTPQAGFNPRPGHATGATLAMGRKPTVPMVSIRAPVTRPGRPKALRSICGKKLFQSAPRSRDRGDATSRSGKTLCASFNPRPGHATGATR